MKKQIFAILDLELSYACSLMEIFSARRSIPFESLIFSSVESLEEYTRNHTIDLLLVSTRMMCEQLREFDICRIVILSEGELLEEYGDYPSVYKYQSSDNLVAEVMDYYASQTLQQRRFIKRKNMDLIGIYSPVARCGKTGFALTLGQILAKKYPVLYLNLEEYAGFESLSGGTPPSDFSDVMYFLRQNKGSVALKVHAAVQKIGSLDYIPPAFSAADLREIKMEDWIRLIEELENNSMYRIVLLDLGPSVSDVFQMLSLCSRIYMPFCEDSMAQEKLKQFEILVQELEYEELLGKTRKLLLPFTELPVIGSYALEQLVEGKMGSFVKNLLMEEDSEYGDRTGRI